MPHKTWIHECTKSHRTEQQGAEICSDCGQRGQYDGWQLGMHEAMLAYQIRTGLRPIGPHRGMADELLDRRWKDCEQCHGRGVNTINDGASYEICPRCHLAQYLFDGSQEEFEELIKRIVSVFPSAPVDAPLGLEPKQAADLHGGFTGGIFIKPKDNSPEAIDATVKAIMKALDTKDTSKKTKHKSKTISTGSTFSNMKTTLLACNPHTRRIFETLVKGWKEAGGTVVCNRPGRIYLKLKTKAHASGKNAQSPRNFNLVVLASPFKERNAYIQITFGLGQAENLFAYLDCIPKVVAQFEKMTASLPGFEQKGTLTRLMIDKQFKLIHTELLLDGMKKLMEAEAKAK
jgi:hypothetical protein